MAERELCDEQNDEAHREMHKEQRPEGTAGYIDPRHLKGHHNREQAHVKEEKEQGNGEHV